MIPKLFVCELFNDDNESMGWSLSSGHYPGNIEVVPLISEWGSYKDVTITVIDGIIGKFDGKRTSS